MQLAYDQQIQEAANVDSVSADEGLLKSMCLERLFSALGP